MCLKSYLGTGTLVHHGQQFSFNKEHIHTHPYRADRTLPKPHFKFAHFHCRWLCDVHLLIVVKFGLYPSTTVAHIQQTNKTGCSILCSSYYRDFSDQRTFGMHCNIGYFSFHSVLFSFSSSTINEISFNAFKNVSHWTVLR